MSGRTGSHQLPNGLIVSGRPEQQKERLPTMASRAVVYTGGDVKKSGELGKMYGIETSAGGSGDHHHHGGPPTLKKPSSARSSAHNSGSVRSGPNSGHAGPKPGGSGPLPKRYTSPSSSFSGPATPIQPTGLITSGPLNSSGARSGRQGNLDRQPSAAAAAAAATTKPNYGPAVTSLGHGSKYGYRVSRVAMWVFLIVMVMGLLVGAFLMVAVKKPVLLVALGAVLASVLLVLFWNLAYKRRGLMGYLKQCPEDKLLGSVDGQLVKITGIVTCGSMPLESSFQRVPRCVYTSTELYEYRGWGGAPANPTHRYFTWGCRASEKYVADFYISDFLSGERALVKAGYGARVTPLVEPTTVVDVTAENRDVSPSFARWLSDRSLSADDRIMRLKESCIKEGDTASVFGMVSKQDNVWMIVPPSEPLSTGCRWLRLLVPTYAEGIVVACLERQDDDVINV